MMYLQRPAARVARVELVPVADVVLAVDPAEVDLAAVAQRGEVDEAALEVAQDEPALDDLGDAAAQLEERLADLLARRPAAVRRRALRQRAARLLVGQPLARVPQRGEPGGEPGQRGARLLDRVVA